jgi:hypothetical protein
MPEFTDIQYVTGFTKIREIGKRMHAGAAASAIVSFFFSFSFTYRVFHGDTYWNNMLFSMLMATIIYGFFCQHAQHRQEVAYNRLRVFRSR